MYKPTDMLIQILVTGMAIVGIHFGTVDLLSHLGLSERVFGFLRKHKWLHVLSMPFFTCMPCMGSVWGTSSYFFYGETWFTVLMVIGAASFAATTLNAVTEFFLSMPAVVQGLRPQPPVNRAQRRREGRNKKSQK